MEVAKDDQRFRRIQSEMEVKRAELRSRLYQLQTTQGENKFLEGVVDDYKRYYAYIKNQKAEELAALQMIGQYVDSIAASTELTEDAISKSKQQQHELLRKTNAIKKELDEIMKAEKGPQRTAIEAAPARPAIEDASRQEVRSDKGAI
jgi:hypothetical protein